MADEITITVKPTKCEICKVEPVSLKQIETLWVSVKTLSDETLYFCGQPHYDDWKRANNVR